MAIFPNNAGVQEESNNFGISFTKILNKAGLRLSPYLTPTRELKRARYSAHPRPVQQLLCCMQYIDLMIL